MEEGFPGLQSGCLQPVLLGLDGGRRVAESGEKVKVTHLVPSVGVPRTPVSVPKALVVQ